MFDISITDTAETWGPYYWFVLHTIAAQYPIHPNDITKRKYYDLIQNFPLFLPNVEMGNKFGELLDVFPVLPYLKTRDSFMMWMYFIHNKINIQLNKPEITFEESLDEYNKIYVRHQKRGGAKNVVMQWKIEDFVSKQYIYGFIIIALLFIIYKWQT